MERLDTAIEAAVRRFLDLIAQNHDVAQAIVFGSYARGEQTPESDVDVAVLLRGEHQRFIERAISDVAYDVMIETDVLISPLPIWVDEWEHPETYSNPDLLHNIDREGIRL